MNTKSEPTVEIHDTRGIYCRLLGHDLTFKYCRQTGTGLFCRKIFDCWHTKLEIARFIKQHFTEEEIQSVLKPPTPKVTTLVGLIEQAKDQ